MIIFESDAQVGGRDGICIIKMFLDVIARFNVERIFTFAAFAQPMSYRNPSQVLVTCNGEFSLAQNQRRQASFPCPMVSSPA